MVFRIFSILAGIGLVMVIFLAPETKYDRPAFAVDGQLQKVDEFGTIVAFEHDTDAAAAASDNGENDKPLTYLQGLLPFQPSYFDKHAGKTIGSCYLHMAYSLLDPAIVFSLGASALALGVNIAISLSFGSVLGRAYHWPSQNTGLIYAGALPACLFAFVCTGWAGDKINLALARRNKGLHIAEHRVSSRCGVSEIPRLDLC